MSAFRAAVGKEKVRKYRLEPELGYKDELEPVLVFCYLEAFKFGAVGACSRQSCWILSWSLMCACPGIREVKGGCGRSLSCCERGCCLSLPSPPPSPGKPADRQLPMWDVTAPLPCSNPPSAIRIWLLHFSVFQNFHQTALWSMLA